MKKNDTSKWKKKSFYPLEKYTFDAETRDERHLCTRHKRSAVNARLSKKEMDEDEG